MDARLFLRLSRDDGTVGLHSRLLGHRGAGPPSRRHHRPHQYDRHVRHLHPHTHLRPHYNLTLTLTLTLSLSLPSPSPSPSRAPSHHPHPQISPLLMTITLTFTPAITLNGPHPHPRYAFATTFVGSLISVKLEHFETHLKDKAKAKLDHAIEIGNADYKVSSFNDAIIQFSDLLQVTWRREGVGARGGQRGEGVGWGGVAWRHGGGEVEACSEGRGREAGEAHSPAIPPSPLLRASSPSSPAALGPMWSPGTSPPSEQTPPST